MTAQPRVPVSCQQFALAHVTGDLGYSIITPAKKGMAVQACLMFERGPRSCRLAPELPL